MQCKTCDYRLWQLSGRVCPECGTSFVPSEFEFVVNSVQFRCPHCDQDYYGTGEKGHLEPKEFDCVSCGHRVHMDEMVLFPTHTVREEQTEVDRNPWLIRKKRGAIKAWFATVGRGLVAPRRLMRATPEWSSAASALWFAILTSVLFCLAGTGQVAIFPIVIDVILGGGRGGLGGAATVLAILGLGPMLVLVVLVLLWGLTAHALLRLTGRTAGGIGRTYHAVCYSAGANAPTAVPCLGIYVCWIGGIWWAISMALMLTVAQRVSGRRAALAALALPLMTLVAAGVLVAYLIASLSGVFDAMSAAAATRAATQQTSAHVIAQALFVYADQSGGQGPDHAARLIFTGDVAADDLRVPLFFTTPSEIPIADTSLDQFVLLGPEERREAVKAAADALPKNTVAHRLGDFVFVYHGIDLSNADRDLWIVIMSPDPDSSGNPVSPIGPRKPPNPFQAFAPRAPQTDDVVVGLAEGTTKAIPRATWPAALAAQNALRQANGLPPIPDPATVTHARPATGPSN